MTPPQPFPPSGGAPSAPAASQEAFYQAAFRCLDEGVVIYDRGGHPISCNPSALRITGLPEDALLRTPLQDPAWHVVDAEGRRLAFTEFPVAKCLLHGTSVRNEIVGVRRDDGSLIWLSVSALPVHLSGPEHHTHVVVSFSDITEERRARAALELSEARYRALIEHSPEAIVVLDAETTRFVDHNAQAESLFLMSAPELRASGPVEISPPYQPDGMRSSEKIRGLLDSALRGNVVRYEWLHLRKTGEHLLCEVRLSRMPAADRILLRGSITDITRRRRSEEYFRILAEQTGQMIYEYDLESGGITWTGAIYRVSGYTPEEFGRFNVKRWSDSIHPEDRETALRSLDKVIQHGGRYEVEYRFRRKDGTYVPVEDHGVVQRDERGIPTVMLGSMADISHRREQERVQHELEVQLRQAQKMEAIGTLAGGIAHDFNNILGAIMGYTELALMKTGEHPGIATLLKESLRASLRARDLIRQILTFSRRQHTEMRPLDPADCIEDAARLLRATLPTSISLSAQSAQGLTILADAAQIQQVLVNLGTNAAHAIGAARGTILLEAAPLEIHSREPQNGFPSLTPGPYVQFTVSDDGCGMEEATLKRIFEPFFTTKPPGQGTGLGLAMAHGIVCEHNGAITASSTPGRGSTFRFAVPCSENAAATDATTPVPSERGHGELVFVVDDEPDVAHVTSRLLELLGYRTATETSPRTALQRLIGGSLRPDLLLVDLSMPDMNGTELAAAVHAALPALPILMITGYGGEWTPERVAQYGVRRVATKPVSRNELGRLVAELLRTPSSP